MGLSGRYISLKVVLHHTGSISSGTEIALASERVHHRTNQPPHRPDPLNFEVQEVFCIGSHGYGDSLKRLWEKGEGFINLEHDVAPWPGALTEMWKCKVSWCALPLIVHGCENQNNFGCVKFGKTFIAVTKGIWEEYPRNEIFDWRSLDGWFYQKMKEKFDCFHHTHRPAALHFNRSHL